LEHVAELREGLIFREWLSNSGYRWAKSSQIRWVEMLAYALDRKREGSAVHKARLLALGSQEDRVECGLQGFLIL